jgi:hypothetical protein
MRYAVQLKKDATNYSGKYVTLIFVNGKYEGDIRPDVIQYLKKVGHEVLPIVDTPPTEIKKTSKKKKEV